jgi:hypothetical protein
MSLMMIYSTCDGNRERERGCSETCTHNEPHALLCLGSVRVLDSIPQQDGCVGMKIMFTPTPLFTNGEVVYVPNSPTSARCVWHWNKRATDGWT